MTAGSEKARQGSTSNKEGVGMAQFMDKLRSVLSSTVVVGGVVFGGWVLMSALSPSKEQMMERLSIDPDEHIPASQKRNKQLFATIQKNIESPDPVWKIKPLDVNKKTEKQVTDSRE